MHCISTNRLLLIQTFHELYSKGNTQNNFFSGIQHGLNRNMKTLLLLNHYIKLFRKKTELESIEQRVFVNGHGFNNYTRSFQKLISNLKPNEGFAPDNVHKIIQQSKFEVVEMTEKDFFSCDPLVQLMADYNQTQLLP